MAVTWCGGAKVDPTLEINVQIPEGADDDVVRIASDNANTLTFDHASFEDE